MLPLEEPRNPFPVRLPHIVRSDMYNMHKTLYGFDEELLFLIDSDYQKTFHECLTVLKEHPKHGRAYLTEHIESLEQCLWEIAEIIPGELPEYFGFSNNTYSSKLLGVSLSRDDELKFDRSAAVFPEEGEACYAHLQQLEPFDRLCDMLRLSIQEDINISYVGPDGFPDKFDCLLVPIPSQWDPDDKIGMDFATMHSPIPHSERLIKAAPNLIAAIMSKGDFVRYNWTIGPDWWNRNPALEPDLTPVLETVNSITDLNTILDALYFRTERQTLRAFPHLHRYLFTIHTYIHPLSTVVTTTERKQILLQALLDIEPDEYADRPILHNLCNLLQAELNGTPVRGNRP